ncbi:uncharacterized protein METZ01_LOCUS307006, partial [marine metagenome]
LENFDKSRGIDVNDLKNQVQDVNNYISNISYTNEIVDSYIITLNVLHE